ncbi:BAHD acyltransferase BIA1-like [Neltuma alba]|nr:BAHD acyltransferase BIA1-like [Prosopis alba]
MNNLRNKVKDDDDGGLPNPTRYQVLSSFISKHMILAYKSKGIISLVLLMHIVDARRKRGDPLSSNSMGNLHWPVMIPYDKANYTDDISLNDLVKITRQNIGSVNKDLFLRIQRDPNFLLSAECGGMLMEGIEEKKPIPLVFSSWCNLGFDEMDFGWGKPLWVGFRGGTQETVPNSVILIDTSQGIEAWITMPEEYLAVLQKDEDFLRYALLNPTVSS